MPNDRGGSGGAHAGEFAPLKSPPAAFRSARVNASAEKIETDAMKRIVVCRDAIGKKG